MCGRYALYGPQSRYKETFATENDLDFGPRYNIAPSQVVPVVRADDKESRIFTLAQWGLIPSWAKDADNLPKPINAKSETAAIKPMFRHAFRKSRVLVPATAFYEWKVIAGKKQPFLIHMKDGEPFGMAGLLEFWMSPTGAIATFTILTTTPNALMAEIHDRMPVIVSPANYAEWLDPALTDVAHLQSMVGPYPERLMAVYPVSTFVNSPAHEGVELVEPLILQKAKELN